MNRFASPCAGVLLAAVLLAAPPCGSPSSAAPLPDTIARADSAFAETRFEDVLTLLLGPLRRSQMAPTDRVRARDLVVRALFRLGRPGEATDVIAQQLRDEPQWSPDQLLYSRSELEAIEDIRRSVERERAARDSLEAASARSLRRRIGIKAGGISTALGGDGVEALDAAVTAAGGAFESTRRSAPTGGLFIELGAGRAFSLQPEVLLSAGGASTVSKINGITREEHFEWALLEIPVLLRWRALHASTRTAWLYLAPSLAQRVGSKGSVAGPDGTLEGNLDDVTRGTTVRLGLGAEARFGGRRGPGWWLDARWITGVGSVFESGATAGDVSENGVALFLGVGR